MNAGWLQEHKPGNPPKAHAVQRTEAGVWVSLCGEAEFPQDEEPSGSTPGAGITCPGCATVIAPSLGTRKRPRRTR